MKLPRVIVLALALLGAANGQDISISAGAVQTNPKQLLIQVTGMSSEQFEAFFGTNGQGNATSAYHIYVITHRDEPEMRADDHTSEYISRTDPLQAGMNQIQVPLLRPLRADTNYLVVISGIGKNGRAIAKLEPKGNIITSDKSQEAREVKVTALVPVGNKQNETLHIERKKATVEGEVAKSTPDTIDARIKRIDADGVVLELIRPLPVGTSDLSVKGLKDTYDGPITAEGKIEIAPAPINESDAYVLVKAGANAAVHQAPIFTLAGTIAPLHPSIHALFFGPVRVDPSTVIDVGLRSTKSANSIIVPAPFTRAVILGLPADTGSTNQVELRKVDPYAMQFMFGPRLETDRNFRRLNSLGELRWDLYIPALSRDMTSRKAKLSAQQPQYRDFLDLPIRGYTFAPYVQFDGGAHVNEETVTNTKAKVSVVVPSHSIARAYFGVKGTIQYGLASINVDTSYVDMFLNETIGYTTVTDALLRHVQGWQPHAKVDLSLFFDKAKHTAFSVTFENGRTAPNFEYLNKVDVGVKVIY